MELLRRIALETVARGCCFASLAIFCTMVGMSFDPVLAFKVGAILTTLMTVWLLLMAQNAGRTPYKRTEWWLYVPENARPPEAHAQWTATVVRREAFLVFARFAAAAAIALWVATIVAVLIMRG